MDAFRRQEAGRRQESGAAARTADRITLCIDVGGSHVKGALVAPDGEMLSDYERVPTPAGGPGAVVDAITGLVTPLGAFARVSVGFPGVVREGVVLSAPNLGGDWHRFRIEETLERALGRKVRVANDATVQGLGAISGHGVECAITLGTGMGFALFTGGRAGPHLELGQHVARKKKSYDEYVGKDALRHHGVQKWNRRVRRTIGALRVLTRFDTLYIGGGNATAIEFDLPQDVHLVSNEAGVTGGVRLWDGPPGAPAGRSQSGH